MPRRCCAQLTIPQCHTWIHPFCSLELQYPTHSKTLARSPNWIFHRIQAHKVARNARRITTTDNHYWSPTPLALRHHPPSYPLDPQYEAYERILSLRRTLLGEISPPQDLAVAAASLGQVCSARQVPISNAPPNVGRHRLSHHHAHQFQRRPTAWPTESERSLGPRIANGHEQHLMARTVKVMTIMV